MFPYASTKRGLQILELCFELSVAIITNHSQPLLLLLFTMFLYSGCLSLYKGLLYSQKKVTKASNNFHLYETYACLKASHRSLHGGLGHTGSLELFSQGGEDGLDGKRFVLRINCLIETSNDLLWGHPSTST